MWQLKYLTEQFFSNFFTGSVAFWLKKPLNPAAVSLGQEQVVGVLRSSVIQHSIEPLLIPRLWIDYHTHAANANATTAHSRMPLTWHCTAHHPPMHLLHACRINTNPRPLPMPYNLGSLLLHFFLPPQPHLKQLFSQKILGYIFCVLLNAILPFKFNH